MVSKKYKLILGLLTLMSTATFAQTEGSGYSVFDSSVISPKAMPQQDEFWNNTYNFPAKPRSMWEIGASLGNLAISGDVSARIPSLGFEAHIRKAMGYVFSLRLQYLNGKAKGMNWTASQNYQKNVAWIASNFDGNLPAGKGYNPQFRDATGLVTSYDPTKPVDKIFYNYKTHTCRIFLYKEFLR